MKNPAGKWGGKPPDRAGLLLNNNDYLIQSVGRRGAPGGLFFGQDGRGVVETILAWAISRRAMTISWLSAFTSTAAPR